MKIKDILTEVLTPDTIHKLADRKGIKWDNDPDFLALTNKLTGRKHLDDLDQEGLKKIQPLRQDILMTEQLMCPKKMPCI